MIYIDQYNALINTAEQYQKLLVLVIIIQIIYNYYLIIELQNAILFTRIVMESPFSKL